MKKIISTTRKTFRLTALAILLLASSTVVKAANGDEDKKTPGSATTAEVKYVGSTEGQPLFNVLYHNGTGARFSIRVLDNEGNQLFLGSYTEKNFDKKFRMEGTETNGKLVFIIRNYKDNSVQSFEVNSNTRLVEDVEVKEVN